MSFVCIRASALLFALLLACWFAPASVAHADSPFADPAFQPPQGGGANTGTNTTTLAVPAIPAGYAEIPLPSSIHSTFIGSTYRQQGALQNPNDPLAWLQLGFNPGKWLLDSVLGAVSGIILSIAGVFQSLALWGMGTPGEGASAASGFISGSILFSTPLHYTTGWGGGVGSTQWIYNIIRLAAISIMTLVFTYRLIRLLAAYNREAAVDLAFAFIDGVIVTQASWSICELLIRAANIIGAFVVDGFTFWDGNLIFYAATPDVGESALISLSWAIVLVAYWCLLGLLVFKAIGRLVLVNLLIIVSPLAGIAVLSGGWNYARVWFFRFVELLITPIAWAIVLGYMRNLMGEFGTQGNQLLAMLMGAYALYLVPRAPEVLGLAAREMRGASAVLVAAATRAISKAV